LKIADLNLTGPFVDTATLPTGTVTFLFTDIEGSTRLWEQTPEAMKAALARHDAILRQAVAASDGYLVKTTGDGVHAAFQTARCALAAALAAQQALQAEAWPEIRPLAVKVRMGIHTGEAEARAGDYYGSALNRATRLMSVGSGGQILVSAATSALVRDLVPDGATLLDLGEHRLKDLVAPEHIYQLTHPTLPSAFPSLKSLDAYPNNLPVQLTSFIGREREVEEAQQMLDAHRLVTLTGSGGTGKTRLALQVAAEALTAFPDGVWLAELAPLTEGSQVVPALAQVFGLQEVPFSTLATLVTEYLRRRKALLIFDNCEHLIDTCARLADSLLRQCPHLKIIASSREALGIAGEAAYRIPSLAEPEAVQLFGERAGAANSTFRLTAANTPEVARICRRLDGIPLAIELAAARAKVLSPEQIAARLNDRFRLLVGGSRTALPRQQTLRALIDWSYDLLSEDEKRLLRVASVFAGGFTLEALEAVSGAENTLETLEALVTKSLVAAEEGPARMRCRLLETIRQYARDRLMDSGVSESARLRTRHLDFFVRMAEAANPRLQGPEMIECLDELEVEQDNLRAAVDWAIETDPVSALRMAPLLPGFWGRRLSATEALAWMSTALARAEATVHPEGESGMDFQRAKAFALLGQATMSFQLGDNISALVAATRSIETARQVSALDILAYALAIGCTVCGFMGDISTAHAWSTEALELSRQHQFGYIVATISGTDAFLALVMGRPARASAKEEALRTARACGNPWTLGLAYTNAGRMEVLEEHWTEAEAFLQQSAELFERIRDKPMLNASRSEIGHLRRKQGRYSEAVAIYRETIRTYQALGQQAAVAHQLECCGFIAAAQRQASRAATLFGAAEALRERVNGAMTPIERREYTPAVDGLRAQMDGALFDQLWAQGRALGVEEAVQTALSSAEISEGS
jgi:predicted ATPase/class 3 adenylate cyclase